jgi:hypothetical protein
MLLGLRHLSIQRRSMIQHRLCCQLRWTQQEQGSANARALVLGRDMVEDRTFLVQGKHPTRLKYPETAV